MFRKATAAAVLLAASLASFPQAQKKAEQPLDQESWELFRRVFGMVLKDYVEPKAPETVILGALKGAASSAGPECAYIPPGEVAAYRALREKPGAVPVYLTKDEDFARVLAVYPGATSEVRAGQALRYIGQASTYDLTYPQILEAMRGPVGEIVRCVFIEPDTWQSKIVDLPRMAPPKPKWLPLSRGAGVLVLPGLESAPPPALIQAMAAAKGKAVVDLRGCASEDVDAALTWIGTLLGDGEGPPRKGAKDTIREAVTGQGVLKGRVAAVVVDAGTARAGEVVAAALVGAGAEAVGSDTYGWAPRFEDIPLQNGGLLHLLTAYYLTPDGQPMNGHSVKASRPFAKEAGQSDAEAYEGILKPRDP